MDKGLIMSINVILDKLQKVKSHGNGSFMACCPAHDDRSPSLSIKDNGDGRIMFKCFAGCETLDILQSIGLDWDDVMPPKQEKIVHTVKPKAFQIYATDAIQIIRIESQIILMAAMDITNGVKISDSEMDRVKKAMLRINTALEAVKNVR